MRPFYTIVLCFILPNICLAQCYNGQCCPGGQCYAPPVKYEKVEWKSTYTAPRGIYESVVRVTTTDIDGSRSIGSGCVTTWNNKVVVLTANHVVKEAREIFVRGKTSWHRCSLIGRDYTWDVAVLTVSKTNDFSVAPLDTTNVEIGETVETAGYGPNDFFSVGTGTLVNYGGPDDRSKPDTMILNGHTRQGDSGGPVFRKGKIVGILWGNRNGRVYATQIGRLQLILSKILGKPKRVVVEETQFCNNIPKLFPQRQQKQQQPQINVQADPRVGDALVQMNHKLDQVIINTTPTAEEVVVEEETEVKKFLPFLTVVVAIVAIVLGFVVYFGANKGE